MNKKQRQVNQKLLDEEKEVIKRLRDCYDQAYKDVSKKILDLSDDPNMISHVHQKKYNQVLKKQIKKALDLLDSGKVDNIQEFLNKTAETSFIGTMYEFNEDIPFLLPMDNETIAKIINKKVGDFSFSERLHGDTSKLTDVTVNEIGRGFSTGMSFDQMALNIKNRFTHDMNNAFRIAQTEGHRVSQETAFDTAKRYKEQGADIVKQWDSTMDRKTRPHHVKLDGRIRELEDPFEVEGHKAMYPGGFGIASEDIRCRCVIVKRARWALEDDETKWDGDQDKLVTIKAKGYEEFKQKYSKEIKKVISPDVKTPLKHILNEDEKRAVVKYISPDSYVLNDKLRNGYDLSDDDKEWIDNLDKALDKLPTYEGTVTRSLEFYNNEDIRNFIASHKVGESKCYNQYLSTTCGEVYNDNAQVQLIIESHTGKDGREYNPSESEILFKRNSSFKVLDIVERDGYTYIMLEEQI